MRLHLHWKESRFKESLKRTVSFDLFILTEDLELVLQHEQYFGISDFRHCGIEAELLSRFASFYD